MTTGDGKPANADTAVLADLHIHTTASDGSETIEQVVQRAKEQGLGLIACTNHDTLKGADHARSLQEHYGITIIRGIEISAWDSIGKSRVHILGLGFSSEKAPAVEALCGPTLECRHDVALWQLEQLVDHGYDIDPESAHQLAEESTGLYKQHLMAALTAAPFGSDEYRALYRLLFRDGGICEREIEYADARDAVSGIKEDGGIAILAHPGKFNNYELVAHLVRSGLDGLEKHHPDHGKGDWDIVDQLARDHGLVVSGGSDYHGAYGKSPHPGTARVLLTENDPLTHLLV